MPFSVKSNEIHIYFLYIGDRDSKAASQGLFQLSKDDVRAFWNDEKLRAAIVSTDNIYIIGELGEGIIYREGFHC